MLFFAVFWRFTLKFAEKYSAAWMIWRVESDKSDWSDESDARQNRPCGIRKHKDNGRFIVRYRPSLIWRVVSDMSDGSDMSDARQNRPTGIRRNKDKRRPVVRYRPFKSVSVCFCPLNNIAPQFYVNFINAQEE